MKYYVPALLKQDITISVYGVEKSLPAKDIADGVVGVALWFDNYDDAKEFAGDNDVLEYEAKLTPWQRKG